MLTDPEKQREKVEAHNAYLEKEIAKQECEAKKLGYSCAAALNQKLYEQRIAEENKIPLYEDPELAKLLAKLELDTEIPSELYTLVAEVLFFVYIIIFFRFLKVDKLTQLNRK